MKNIFLSLLLIFFIPSAASGQFYIVEDPDGYVNVRGENNRIIDRVPSGTIVYEEMPETEWAYGYNSIYISCKPEGHESRIRGNIHISRLKDINEFEPFVITDMDTVNHLFVKFALGKIKLNIETDYFDENKHTITRIEETDYSRITAIDDMKYWYPNYGTNMVPFTEIKSITANIHDTVVNIPNTGFKDLFNLNVYSSRAFYDATSDTVYLIMPGGDGGESYVAMFVIKNGKFVKRCTGT